MTNILGGLNYCVYQKKYLRVFLEDDDAPIDDDSAIERSICPFTIDLKNFAMINTIKGAKVSTIIYYIV